MRVTAALVAAAWAGSLAVIYNVCNLLFGCGCTWAWAGAAEACNVHHAAPPHCPWCSHGGWTFLLLVLLPVLGAEAAVVAALRRRSAALRLVAAAAAFLAAGAVVGLAFALADRYPHFIGLPLR